MRNRCSLAKAASNAANPDRADFDTKTFAARATASSGATPPPLPTARARPRPVAGVRPPFSLPAFVWSLITVATSQSAPSPSTTATTAPSPRKAPARARKAGNQ